MAAMPYPACDPQRALDYFTVTKRAATIWCPACTSVFDALHDPVRQRVAHLPCGRGGPDNGQIVQRIFANVGKCP